MDPRRQLVVSFGLLLLIITGGTIGYRLIEGLAYLESFYMTIITVSTVGFKEVVDLSPAGRLFTILLILFGVGNAFWLFTNLTHWVIEVELRQFWEKKGAERRIAKLQNHYILCGFGRVGRLIAKEFYKQKVPFLLIEKDQETLMRYQWEGLLSLQGNATEEEILIQAGVEKAKGLITALPSDAENLLITITARGLNPDLYILARGGEEEGSERKLQRAGANKVISPYHIGGLRMAHTILKPTVVDFVEIATHDKNLELELDEVQIPRGSPLAKVALRDSGIRQDHGVIIVAVKKSTGEMVFNPSPDIALEEGDRLVALGEPSQLKRLEERALRR